MTTSTTHTQKTPQAPAAKKLKAPKKARAVAPKAHVAPPPANKARPPKKGARAGKKLEGARHGSKTAKVLDLLKRPGGASLKELMKATGWQPHSVREFLSGTLGKKMNLMVTSAKVEGERSYAVQA